jgi:hypothetical protein
MILYAFESFRTIELQVPVSVRLQTALRCVHLDFSLDGTVWAVSQVLNAMTAKLRFKVCDIKPKNDRFEGMLLDVPDTELDALLCCRPQLTELLSWVLHYGARPSPTRSWKRFTDPDVLWLLHKYGVRLRK